MIARSQAWTNSSVLALAGDADPIQVITERARNLAMKAIQDGWAGPPYDPFALADYLKIDVVARQDIPEARTVPSREGFLIEFNPDRPRPRIKYSICHELAHTLFPDCSQRVRNRITHRDMVGDQWQLETLCNIGAAELLMPLGSTPSLESERLTIDAVLAARKQHEVSSEAVLLRAIRLTSDQCFVFSSSRRVKPGTEALYAIDYAISSRSWNIDARAGMVLPVSSVAQECIAIGFTAKGHETWQNIGGVRVECLGVSPYPNHTHPRVLGIVRPQKKGAIDVAGITYIRGDATHPRGSGPVILAQIVNDSAFTWGAGFSLAVREQWPTAQKAFRAWAEQDKRNLRLGNIHIAETGERVTVASMIAQHGFGPSPKPRIRYMSLRTGLEQLAKVATQRSATVHMPKIGSGQAGGSWNIVRELVQEALCAQGIRVFVYELPSGPGPAHPQAAFEFA